MCLSQYLLQGGSIDCHETLIATFTTTRVPLIITIYLYVSLLMYDLYCPLNAYSLRVGTILDASLLCVAPNNKFYGAGSK